MAHFEKIPAQPPRGVSAGARPLHALGDDSVVLPTESSRPTSRAWPLPGDSIGRNLGENEPQDESPWGGVVCRSNVWEHLDDGRRWVVTGGLIRGLRVAVCVALERLANKVYDGEYDFAYRKVS